MKWAIQGKRQVKSKRSKKKKLKKELRKCKE